MSRNKIALIGSGNIGVRHLQGLLKSEHILEIYIVDPNVNSLKNAKILFEQISNSDLKHNVTYLKSIDKLPKKLHIVIIATTSIIRRRITEELLNSIRVVYLILEKIVFQNPKDFYSTQKLLLKNNTKAWINCPQRTYPLYKKLKDKYFGEQLTLTAEGKNWGIACNAIHFIDLFVFLTGDIKLNFDLNQLDDIIYSSKREGFVEFRGTLKVNSYKGHRLILTDNDFYDEKIRSTFIFENEKYFIVEKDNIIKNEKSHFLREGNKYKFPFQSEITGLYVDQILNEGEPDLVSYKDCMTYHVPMLNAFNKYISTVTKNNIIECPIT